MPRFFLGNFEFEHRLAKPKGQLAAKLDRINAELATSWLTIADDGDYLWTPQPIAARFFEDAAVDQLPRVIPVVSLDAVPRGIECQPWGWTDDVRRLCDKHGWVRNDPPDAAVRAVNSRRLSSALEQEWLVGPEFAGEATSIEQIERFRSFHDPDTRWVIKAEFGMSGRERLIGSGSPTEADRNWIAKRLAADGVVFFEPWVERLSEVGIQIDVPLHGEPQLIGITPMFVNAHGQYSGSEFRSAQAVDTVFNPAFNDGDSAVEVALRAARRIQDQGYFGPLGIDCMRYRGADGLIRLRPLQDINARWTMGRLSLGLRRLLKSGEFGFWWHGPDLSSEVENRVQILRAYFESRQMRLTQECETVARHLFESIEEIDGEESIDDELVERILRKIDSTSRRIIIRTAVQIAEAGLFRFTLTTEGRPRHFPSSPTFVRQIQTSPQSVGGEAATHKSVVMISRQRSPML